MTEDTIKKKKTEVILVLAKGIEGAFGCTNMCFMAV